MNVLLGSVCEWEEVCVSVTEKVCVCGVCVCWSGGHTACPPETDRIRSNENRATCPHHNWIKEAIDTNWTSMQNQCWINAKQLTAAPCDVFKARLAVRQTDWEREETVFNTIWHFTVSAEQKGISPHTCSENGFDWKFIQNLKLVTVPRSVFWSQKCSSDAGLFLLGGGASA